MGRSRSVVQLDADGEPIENERLLASSEAPAAGCAIGTLNGSVVAAYVRTAPEPEFANILRVFVRRLGEDISRRRAVRR